MSSRLRTALALAGSFALGGGLLYLALRGVDAAEVAGALRDAQWGWLVPLAVVSVLSVVLRAWRWAILLDTLPQKDGTPQREPTPFGIVLASLLVGYLVNLAIPRLGEVVRAGNLAARRPLGFAAVVGTVVADRILDVVMLVVALASVVLLFGERLGAVAGEAASGMERLLAGLPVGLDVLLAGGAVALTAAVLLLVWKRRRAPEARGPGLAAQFRDGALTVVRTGRPVAMVVSTLAIWACYVTMSYLPLRLLGMTADFGLGVVDAWGLMTVGAVGMSLPAPGGAGSFHYATIQTLVLLFGVPASPSTSYAVLGHAAQLVFYAVAGVAALVWQGTGLKAVTQAARSQAPAPVEA